MTELTEKVQKDCPRSVQYSAHLEYSEGDSQFNDSVQLLILEVISQYQIPDIDIIISTGGESNMIFTTNPKRDSLPPF